MNRFDPADGAVATWALPERIGSFALRSGGGAVAAMANGFAFLDLMDGSATPVIDPEAEKTDHRFNDGKCDPAGRFWAGTMHRDYRAPVGTLYRLDPDRHCHAVANGLRVPNGLAWSPDGLTFYMSDSPVGVINAWDFDAAAGDIANRRAFVDPGAAPGFPDGSAVDAEGHLWNARWDGACVARFAPDGRLDCVIDLPVSRPTSCAFGGKNLDTLFITSAAIGLSAEDLAAQPLAGGLFAVDTGVAGLREAAFAG